MLCGNCGHDNPRENRYCGMCGTPFSHRLAVPDEQSALAFSSAPIVVTSSRLPIPEVESPQAPETAAMASLEVAPAPIESAPATEPPNVLAPANPPDATAEIPAIELPLEAAPPLPDSPTIEPKAVSVVAETEARAETTTEAIPIEMPEAEPAPTIEESVSSPDVTGLLAEDADSAVAAADMAPLPEPSWAAPPPPETLDSPPVAEEPAAPPQPASHEAAPILSLPEVVEPVALPPPPPVEPLPPPRAAPPARIDTPDRRPTVIPRPPAPQPIASPPPSAGMPTFRSVAEASGSPVISPFEPPEDKPPDEDRELREFVASFRYTPPDEAFDELTMRSEVPVLDKEAPVTPSHPSFDDDVPPPPEAGPHPTGAEYHQPVDPAASRSRFLDIAEARQPDSGNHATTGTSTSFLGLESPPPSTAPPPDEVAPPSRTRWLLWWSLAAVLVIFGGLGFLEGRAQINHANHGPVEFVVKQLQKLRQRVLTSTVKAPAAPASIVDKQAAAAPKSSETEAKAPATDQTTTATNNPQPGNADAANSAASPAPQAQGAAEHQPPQPAAPTPQSKLKEDNQTAAIPPPSEPAATKPAAAKPIEPPAPPSGSKHEPGQQELAKAMQASDSTAAAAWLWKATSRGNPEAPVLLADMYIKGKGVPRSCEQALVLLRSAATKENAPARNRLAALYANGTCVARDRVKAYQLMSSALVADPGSDWAQQSLKDLWQQMTPQERVLAEKYR